MKVMYCKGKAIEDGWLKRNVEYVVLYITTSTDGTQEYLIWSDEQSGVALFPVSEFTITDHSISNNWVILTDLNECLVLGPKSWIEGDFWDRYHDGDLDTEDVFKKELNKMT